MPTHGDFPGVVFFKLRGTWLSLYPRDELAQDANMKIGGRGFVGFTLAHNVDSKEEVDAVLQRAIAAGATLQKPAQDAVWSGYYGYFCDPDGFLWEIAWNPDFDLTGGSE